MPKRDLIVLIEKRVSAIAYEDDIANLFRLYGDDYFCNMGEHEFELTKVNNNREDV